MSTDLQKGFIVFITSILTFLIDIKFYCDSTLVFSQSEVKLVLDLFHKMFVLLFKNGYFVSSLCFRYYKHFSFYLRHFRISPTDKNADLNDSYVPITEEMEAHFNTI